MNNKYQASFQNHKLTIDIENAVGADRISFKKITKEKHRHDVRITFIF